MRTAHAPLARRAAANPALTAAALASAAAGAYLAARWARRRAHRIDFAGRVVFITGGSRGLGLVMARQLLAEGARVAICARDGRELERAAADLAPRGDVLALVCDVTDRDAVERTVAAIADRWGPVEILINNAGVMRVGPAQTMTEEDFRDAMDAHLWGPIHTIASVLPEMRRRRAGRIVNIASIGGKVSVPHLLPYCTSKFALVGLSDGLRNELAPEGILVTTICPGLMRTGSPVHAEFKGRHRAEHAWFTVAGSLPLASMDARRAARKIIEACRHGDPHLTLSIQAKAAAAAAAVAPGLTGHAMSAAARVLPRPGGIGTAHAKGRDSRSAWAPSVLTTLTDRAAVQNNESPPPEPPEPEPLDQPGD